ncbi:MAG: matrixin family metalloprotease [Phycisphaerales bacterium]|nr:matrixin family metalloprotease [Phycisphaerales bacterium]
MFRSLKHTRRAAPGLLAACAASAFGSTGIRGLDPIRPDLTQMVCLEDPMPESAGASDDRASRSRLMLALRLSPACYDSTLRPSELEALIAQTQLLPPALGQFSTRYYTDTFVWQGDLDIGPSARALPAHLTYSFPADGTSWGMEPPARVAPNDLNARLVQTFGDIDRGREYLRAALACWRKYSGVTYTEVADDNTLMTGSSDRVATRGDIRIGGLPFSPAGPNGFLAFNGFPSGLGASSIAGGDMAINTSYFTASWYQNATNDYRALRNTAAHEHGHGLGCIHSVPCDTTKLMEPMIFTSRDMLQRDEIRAAQRNYGDRFAGNQTFNTAKHFGDLSSPSVRSVMVRDLSTNGSGGWNFSRNDYFKFTLTSPQPVVLSATPIGELSNQGQQVGGCAGTLADVDSLVAGNLRIELLDATGTLIPPSSPAQASGLPAVIDVGTLAAGTYGVRVYDTGGNIAANQYVQNYDLLIRVNGVNAPPEAIAGIDKRVQAGANAWFNGSVNSRANQTGATLPIGGFDWDFDGDGVLDITDNPQPSFVFPSNGIFPVTLHLTDSLGTTGTDTINVTVFGATTVVSSVIPNSATPGTTVPVTILGANFKGVTAASQIAVSGGGVTVVGTPLVDAIGSQITGLSFVLSSAAVSGPRNVTITNSDGQGSSGVGNGAFSVGAPPGPPVNDECTGALSWGSATGPQPFNNVGATLSASQTFSGTGCPAAGPIENDVWYSWTAPASGTLAVTTNSANVGFASRVALYRITANCPPTAAAFRCEDFGGTFTLNVTAGQLYRFQVGSVTPGITGAAEVILTLTPATGGCCQDSGACTVTTDTGCDTGVWLAASTCNPNICPPPMGACCTSAGCSVETQADCDNIPGDWHGFGTSCDNPSQTCCAADFNGVGGVTLQDLFDYLDAWFASDPAADINGAGGVTLQDLFDYLDLWFTGC